MDAAQKAEKTLDRLGRMGIRSWEQVLLYLPKKFEDYTHITQELPVGGTSARGCYELTVTGSPNKSGISPPRIGVPVSDGKNSAKLTSFGVAYPWSELKNGQKIAVEAVVDIWNGCLQVNSPVLIQREFMWKVVPRYAGKRGQVSEEYLYERTRMALAAHLDATAEFMLSHFDASTEADLFARAGISYGSLAEILRAVHAPRTAMEGERGLAAVRSLAAYEVVQAALRRQKRKPNPKSVVRVQKRDVDALISRLPFCLTSHQSQAIADITNDLARPYSMSRLLSGDVGSGKSVTYLVPALAARMGGAKVAVLTPNTLLAAQIAKEVGEFFGCVPVKAITGDAASLKEADLTDNPLMIGTTALISRAKKAKWVPDFLVIDEQQKLSVSQKASIVHANTNLLEATATCIPRTAAMVTHGGMDVSVLNQFPVAKRIESRIVRSNEGRRLFEHVKRVIDSGWQTAVIYPLVDGGARKGVEAAAAEWQARYPGKVAMLHGKMSEAEKLNVVEAMRQGRFSVLICSSVIEIGLNLNFKSLVVVHAERYGVSTLHQMRGRLARFGGTGYFFMYLPDEVEAETLDRLELLVKYSDGFMLSEKDMEMRGFGDLNDDSESQHGVSRSTMFFGVKLMPSDIRRFS